MKVSFPFNSVNHDRRYKSDEWAAYFASFIGTGIFPNPSTNLQVTANGNMTVTVQEGKAWIKGRFFSDEITVLTLDNPDGVLDRIDRIVVRCDYAERLISLKVKKGSYSQNPAPPALQRDADAYELALADVRVNKGTVNIQQAHITDLRLNSSLCGYAVGLIKEIDTTTLAAQLESWFALYQKQSQAEYEALKSYMDSLKNQGDTDYADLQTWFYNFKTQSINEFTQLADSVREILDATAAGNLLNLINECQNRIKRLEDVIFTDITTNPFLILFDDLEGVQVQGIWNQQLQRIEC